MEMVELAAFAIASVAAFAILNRKVLKLPTSVALTLNGLVVVAVVVAVAKLGGFDVLPQFRQLIVRIDFGNLLIRGMLGPWLFAGALHVNLDELRANKMTVGVLALGGTLLSTVIAGGLAYVVLTLFDVHIGIVESLLFGALISPTDPIAVLGMLKRVGAPAALEACIAGESLFNDGVGVVLFVVLVAIVTGGRTSSFEVGVLLVRQVVGGVLFGAMAGWCAVRLLRGMRAPWLVASLTVTIVVGAYAAAEFAETSAPIAIVIAGLVVGHHRRNAMFDNVRIVVDRVWTAIDESLNALLFLLVGLCAVLLSLSTRSVWIGLAAIPAVLLARVVSVAACVALTRPRQVSTGQSLAVLSWGGLRGGLSLAMALSIPLIPCRGPFLVMTYVVVMCSICVQGTTFRWLLQRVGFTSADFAPRK